MATSLAFDSCLSCGDSLDFYQPDPERPDALLGTCFECGAWYRVDTLTGEIQRLVIDTPAAIPAERGQKLDQPGAIVR